MANSLYEISEELRQIFNSAAENDGELTQEEYDKLIITEENFREKCEDYCKAIILAKGDIDTCKCEKQRINSGQQIKVHLVEKLRERLLDAVLEFGAEKEGKNGITKTLEAGTFKLFTKNTVKFNVDEYRKKLLQTTVLSYFKELFINKCLITDDYLENAKDEKSEIAGFLGAVNAIAKSKFEEDVENNLVPPLVVDSPTPEWIDFTIDDLRSLNFGFEFELSAYDLITSGTYIAQAYCNDLGLVSADAEVNPICEIENITLGKNQIVTSLTIK